MDLQVPWVDGLTFAEVLERTRARLPAQDALVFVPQNIRWCYREFHDRVLQLARALVAIGVGQGEHVGIWSTNWPEWVLTQFAVAEIGAVLVNINPAYRSQELEYVLRQADIAAIIIAERSRTTDFLEVLREVCPEVDRCEPGVLQSQKCPHLRSVISIPDIHQAGVLDWSDLLQRAESVRAESLHARRRAIRADDVVNIQYTSGTTGFPKGAMLSHRNLLMNAYYVGQRLAFQSGDRLCIPVPFYHCFGCVMGTLMCAVYGAAMILPSESFDPLATLQAIAAERCTGVYGVPTMFIAELNHPRFGEFSLHSLRTGIMAGSPCPIEIMRAVVDKMGAREMTIAYGLTEASPVITQTEVTDSLEQRVGTVGKAIPGIDVRIVKPSTLEAVAPGEPGELLARGHGIMKGYYQKPTETAAAITPDGWLHTGDLAAQTPDGYYRITGRIKDLIIRGGENIYPREIEEFLFTHPAVADAQVVGLPDLRRGEEVCAWIRLKPGVSLTEDELRAFCRERIAHYKVPRYIVFVEEFPTTVTGKVQKYKLRQLGVERFGLQKAAGVETA